MINRKEFRKIGEELALYDHKREGVIQSSRDIIKISKQIISSVHRDDMEKAKSLVGVIKAKVKKLPADSYSTGMRAVALQEYVEALAFYHFAAKHCLITKKEAAAETESYLLGLCDLTGELMRLAVNSVIKGDHRTAYEVKELVSDLYSEFLNLDLRNGELRKKFDQIKWNLRKIEDVVYDLKMKSIK